MFNAIKIHNVDEFSKYGKGTRITYTANGEDGVIAGELEINTVGPCVARLVIPEGESDKTDSYLLGCYEGNKTLQFAIKAQHAAILLEPSGEVWFRNSKTFVLGENPNPTENFTRMEKMGLEMDDLAIALHRQDILHRIAADRENIERDQYQRRLERQLEEQGRVVAELQAARVAEQEAKAAQEAEASQAAE